MEDDPERQEKAESGESRQVATRLYGDSLIIRDRGPKAAIPGED
jgi:hypothetical protein